MHKINLETSKSEFERDWGSEREEKGGELIRNVRNGRIKKTIFFLIDWGATEQEKRKQIDCHVVLPSRQKKKKKKKKIVGAAPSTTNVAPPLRGGWTTPIGGSHPLAFKDGLPPPMAKSIKLKKLKKKKII